MALDQQAGDNRNSDVGPLQIPREVSRNVADELVQESRPNFNAAVSPELRATIAEEVSSQVDERVKLFLDEEIKKKVN
jgi:hypothetical protein